MLVGTAGAFLGLEIEVAGVEALKTTLPVPEEGLIFETVAYLCGGVIFTALPTSIARLIGETVRISLWTLIAEVVVLILKILWTDTLTLV